MASRSLLWLALLGSTNAIADRCSIHVADHSGLTMDRAALALVDDKGLPVTFRTDALGNSTFDLPHAGIWTAHLSGFKPQAIWIGNCEQLIMLGLSVGRLNDPAPSLTIQVKGLPHGRSRQMQTFLRLTHVYSGRSEVTKVDPDRDVARFPHFFQGRFSAVVFTNQKVLGQQTLDILDMDPQRIVDLGRK